jgi:hypothetical protein
VTEQTSASSSTAAPSPALLLAGVCALAIVVAGLLGLYALAPTRPDVGPLFAALPGGIAAIGVAVVGWMNRRAHAQTSASLGTIKHNTNGALTARINAAVSDAIAATVPPAVGDALATRRADDQAPAVVLNVPTQPALTDALDNAGIAYTTTAPAPDGGA